MSNRFVLITGCSGGGKSTLVEALAARGYATVSEPGRRIVAAEMAGDGASLPWIDLKAFATAARDMALADLVAAEALTGLVFFDRGLIDAAVGLQFAGGYPYRQTIGTIKPFAKTVFLAPPWQEIFVQDRERQLDFDAAQAEYVRVKAALVEMRYDTCLLPKTTVANRVKFVLENVDGS